MRKQFSKKDCRDFLQHHPEANELMTKKSNVVQDDDALYIENTLSFILMSGEWIPSVRVLIEHPSLLPRIVVDKGAIRFVVNGADIMRPGIIFADQFKADSLVVVVDETVGKPIAVGKALFSSEKLMEMDSGKVVATLHHIDDKYWAMG
ncbi:MAG: PUA domain-containing protein [Nanoarchaeota archaeon]